MQFQIGLISSYSSYQWPSWGCCAVFGGGYAFLADLLWIGGCRGCGMYWCLAWLAGWLRWARGQAPSSVVLVVCADFGGGGGGGGFGPLFFLKGGGGGGSGFWPFDLFEWAS